MRNVYIGLMLNSVVPKGSNPKHCAKLVSPNTAPRMAPFNGPSSIAPKITGTVKKVMDKGPIFK